MPFITTFQVQKQGLTVGRSLGIVCVERHPLQSIVTSALSKPMLDSQIVPHTLKLLLLHGAVDLLCA